MDESGGSGKLEVTRSRINELTNGRVSRFSFLVGGPPVAHGEIEGDVY